MIQKQNVMLYPDIPYEQKVYSKSPLISEFVREILSARKKIGSADRSVVTVTGAVKSGLDIMEKYSRNSRRFKSALTYYNNRYAEANFYRNELLYTDDPLTRNNFLTNKGADVKDLNFTYDIFESIESVLGSAVSPSVNNQSYSTRSERNTATTSFSIIREKDISIALNRNSLGGVGSLFAMYVFTKCGGEFPRDSMHSFMSSLTDSFYDSSGDPSFVLEAEEVLFKSVEYYIRHKIDFFYKNSVTGIYDIISSKLASISTQNLITTDSYGVISVDSDYKIIVDKITKKCSELKSKFNQEYVIFMGKDINRHTLIGDSSIYTESLGMNSPDKNSILKSILEFPPVFNGRTVDFYVQNEEGVFVVGTPATIDLMSTIHMVPKDVFIAYSIGGDSLTETPDSATAPKSLVISPVSTSANSIVVTADLDALVDAGQVYRFAFTEKSIIA